MKHAVRCAYLRRRIAEGLVTHWFGSKLRVAGATGYGWNSEQRGFELQTEFSTGRAPQLHHPLRMADSGEYKELLTEIMAPLQSHLAEAGFDGLVWQAGKGNPVALNNFLLETSEADGERSWVWIDLESGVPALIPFGLRPLLGYYIPRSLHHRTPLFDDVDVPRLRAYAARHADALTAQVGDAGMQALLSDIDDLERHQRAWKSKPRHHRSIGYRLALGDIDAETAMRYRTRAIAWYTREALGAVHRLPGKVARGASAVAGWVRRIPVGAIVSGTGRFLVSQSFRAATARKFLDRRIDSWRDRSQMTAEDAAYLRTHLESEESSAYLTDFGVHVAIKPFVKSFEYWLMPALFALGLVNGTVLAATLVVAGSAGPHALHRWTAHPIRAARSGETVGRPRRRRRAGPRELRLSPPDRLFIDGGGRRHGKVHPLRRVRADRETPAHLGRSRHAYRARMEPPARAHHATRQAERTDAGGLSPQRACESECAARHTALLTPETQRAP